MPDWLLWLLPVPVATAGAIAWTAWSSRARRPQDTAEGVAAYERFRLGYPDELVDQRRPGPRLHLDEPGRAHGLAQGRVLDEGAYVLDDRAGVRGVEEEPGRAVVDEVDGAAGVRRDVRKDSPYLCYKDNWDGKGAPTGLFPPKRDEDQQ